MFCCKKIENMWKTPRISFKKTRGFSVPSFYGRRRAGALLPPYSGSAGVEYH